MTYNHYPNETAVTEAIAANEPLLIVISFNGESAIAAPLDEAVEHHILLTKCGYSSLDIDKYFRVIVDRSGADWTFVCPPDYKGIADKRRRIERFYNDGFTLIARALALLGYYVGINIPKRYNRHLNELGNGD
jgi:hypothetical protein